MFEIIKKLFNPSPVRQYFGADFDPRSDEEKKRDYSANEIPLASSIGQPFTNKKPEQLGTKEFPQYRVGMCGPSGTFTQCEYMGMEIPGSRLDLYSRRANKGTPGTWMSNNFDNLLNGGFIPYTDLPNDPTMTEAQSNLIDPKVFDGKRIKFDEFKTFKLNDPKDFQKIAALVNSGFAVQIAFYADFTEWGHQYVTVKTKNLDPMTAPVRHFVTFFPFGDFTEDGKQLLTAHDSSPQNGVSMWFADEEFVKTRVFDAGVVSMLVNEPKKGRKPSAPIEACENGQENEAVRKLQNWLISQKRYDGTPYLGSKYNTGYYGGLTSHALLKWQRDNMVEFKKLRVPVSQIESLAGHYYGPASIKVALKLDAQK